MEVQKNRHGRFREVELAKCLGRVEPMQPYYSLSRIPGYRFRGNDLVRIIFPRYLFRYMSFSELALSTFRENYLWFSKAKDLNDPFDLGDILQREFTDTEIESFLLHNSKRMAARMPNENEGSKLISEMREHISTMGDNERRTAQKLMQVFMRFLHQTKVDEASVCCFSVDSSVPLLWAHYANGHRGFCLVYDSTKLISEKTQILEVKYANELTYFPYLERRLTLMDSARFQLEFSQAVFGQKSADWAYEKEFRIISHTNGRNEIPPEAIVGVVFGARMEDPEKEILSQIAFAREIEVPLFHSKLNASARSVEAYPFRNQLVHADVKGFTFL